MKVHLDSKETKTSQLQGAAEKPQFYREKCSGLRNYPEQRRNFKKFSKKGLERSGLYFIGGNKLPGAKKRRKTRIAKTELENKTALSMNGLISSARVGANKQPEWDPTGLGPWGQDDGAPKKKSPPRLPKNTCKTKDKNPRGKKGGEKFRRVEDLRRTRRHRHVLTEGAGSNG